MKHGGSTSGRSSMRGKCEGIFFNAWNGGGIPGQMESNSRGSTANKGIYRLIESR